MVAFFRAFYLSVKAFEFPILFLVPFGLQMFV